MRLDLRFPLRFGVAAILAATVRAVAAGPDGAAPPPGWILESTAFRLIRNIDPALARRYFDNPRTYVMSGPESVVVPAGWRCIPIANFKSFSKFSAEIARGAIHPGIRAIMYDNESWADTPPNEQPHPADFERRFAELAHAHGYGVVLTPAMDITHCQPGYTKGKAGAAAFLALGIARFTAAAPADLYNIQVQSLQGAIDVRNPRSSSYVEFLTQAVAQAHQGNPRTILFAGISTARGSADQMLAAVLQTRGLVSGYWLNVPRAGTGPDAPKAVDFLRKLEAVGPPEGR